MARSAISAKDGPTHSVPRSRAPVNQMMVGVVLLSMGVLIVYMYRIIDDLHREQQDLRGQLMQLAKDTAHAGSEKFLRKDEPGDFFAHSGAQARRRPHVEEIFPGHMAAFEDAEEKRRLAGFMTTGTSAGVGCFEISDAATVSIDVSSTSACNSNVCPDCFITPATVSQDITLTIQACSSAQWIRSTSRSGVWVYTFINTHATQTVSVADNSGAGITYKVPAQSYVTAYCAASLGTGNRLNFPSTTLPTLSVDSGLTLSAGDFDASASTGAFKTSSGAVTVNGDTTISGAKTFTTGTGNVGLNGATTVADSTTFTVGSAGAGGTTTLYGNTVVGDTGSGNGASITLNGNFAQADVTGSTSTFSTGTATVSLNGHVEVANNKNLHMTNTGSGTFQTGTGTVTLNGATTVSSANTFTTGTGAVTLNGNTAIADSMTFTVGSAGAGGASTLYGNLVVGSTASGGGATTTVNGNFAQGDVTGASVSTFSTGTGAISLNGDVEVATGKNLHMVATSSGTFQSGTGTVTFNGNTQLSGSTTFTTGTGQINLNGATQVADSTPFSVGSISAGGTTQLFGAVIVGSGSANGASTSLDVYGDVTFHDDQDGTAKTFASATGAVTFNGDIGVAAAKNLIMANTGTGQFQTGTGTVTLSGDTTVSSGKTLTVATYTNVIQCSHASGETGSTYCRASR